MENAYQEHINYQYDDYAGEDMSGEGRNALCDMISEGEDAGEDVSSMVAELVAMDEPSAEEKQAAFDSEYFHNMAKSEA